MDKHEFAVSMALLSAAIDNPIGKTTIAAWYEIVKDLPGAAFQAAVHTVVATDEYPVLPSIGKLRKTAIELMDPRSQTAAEAWGLTIRAIKGYGHQQEKAALASLPPEAAEAARLMGWQQMCHAENIEVIRGQYLRIYDTQAARRTQDRLIPPEAKALIEQLAERLTLGPGEKQLTTGKEVLRHERDHENRSD